MSEWSGPSRVNWRQAWGEALLIFLGVAVALLGQAWWEYRTDRELEAHLLTGIRGDLERDSSDIASAIGVELTPNGGHLISKEKGVRNGRQNEAGVSAGVSRTDRGVGAGGSNA
jgi:hypothetical protein